ncbi:transporter substrate-binding domain-containing protein [Methanoculleus sp. FWC-SCC1]|uniref:Transporter substrate-binding domain-containing protein n=1 Tax=Methanoculleus frigidifontis TaxID=2584085 RepID=A0ABT8MAZ7_9EURY|nr:transporter substrate-binding domain-containing protein [Methanoculleus sp. FWC-SCC1]MDN7025103.1 transporter substrate-binding domain-containing protein [Methanoculleus sp. FWC-SCC1]
MSPSKHHILLLCVLVLTGMLLASGCLSNQQATAATGTVSATDLTYYTEQNPPYNFEENGSLQGISIDLLELISAKMGENVSREEVRLVPWTEGYQAALTQNTTVIFTTARLPEREQSFKWVGPIYPYINALFARPDSGIAINNSSDLEGYRIGVIVDDVAVRQLLDAGVNESQLVYETDVFAIIEKLESGEIDLWAYQKESGRYFTWQAKGNAYAFRIVSTLPPLEGYYAFSRDVPDATIQSFQQALDSLKAEKDAAGISTYERVVGRYAPIVGLAHLQYLTEELAPYNFEENGTPTGISVEILEAIFRDIGMNRSREDVRIVPFAEGVRAAQNGSTVLFSVVRTPEREPLYKWAGPFTTGRIVIYAPMDRNITIASAEDLNRYRIGTVQASVENDQLADEGVNASQIVNGPAPEDLLRMLDAGEIDLWATGDLAGRHQMLQTAENPNAYEIVYTLSENDLYYAFSEDVPDMLVGAFEQSLQNVRSQRDVQGVSEYERILYRYLGVGCTRQTLTDADVMALVNRTAAEVEKNAAGTFRQINNGEAPYRDPENPGLYVFVYDENATLVANADNVQLVGINYRGKTDVTGKPFRDEIIAGAQENGTGWVDYVYSSPAETNLYSKTTYYRLTEGSNNETYVVCSGRSKGCEE